ncbi:MAG: hypothetical protein AAF601_05790 [Pseudomonadota bacterium]
MRDMRDMRNAITLDAGSMGKVLVSVRRLFSSHAPKTGIAQNTASYAQKKQWLRHAF